MNKLAQAWMKSIEEKNRGKNEITEKEAVINSRLARAWKKKKEEERYRQ